MTADLVDERPPGGPVAAPDLPRLHPTLTGPRARLRWQRRYAICLVIGDAALLFAGATAAALLRWGEPAGRVRLHGLNYYGVAGLTAILWVAVLASSGAYDPRRLGVGADEFRRVTDAALRMLGLVALVVFVGKLPLSRGFVAIALPLGLLATVGGRRTARTVVHRLHRKSACLHRVLVVGGPAAAARLSAGLARAAHAGYEVVGTWTPQPTQFAATSPARERLRLLEILSRSNADTLAVASSAFSPTALREIARQLEGSGVDLLVSPALTDVAGPRIHVRPLTGLPLLHIEEPQLEGGRQLLKSSLDRLIAVLLLLVLTPPLLAVAAAIRITSHGPALFRQERTGRDGRTFRIFKFRTMYDGSDAKFASLVESCKGNPGGMFAKDRRDPRITPLGRVLRRYSIDELPQLLNVVKGEMSLVGPRPLPSSVEQQEGETRRRLLVRPGMTGLWQVSGRSDLPWQEAIRLDLYYVENWSPSLDLAILWRTALTILRGHGAY